ncbi:MAG: peptidoglycan-binding protein, partial [Myxococcaceae bacterium]|nr:peptidoglycan-binding protein [Myxococcaceae bacterium]
GVLPTAPPRVLLIWPNVVTIECVVASVDFQYRQFAVDSTLLAYAASVTFEEVLDRRVTSEDLRRQVS